jgi:lysosomal alpha-mannosidase
MTFVWEPNDKNVGGDQQILTHIFPVHYAWPADFNYDARANGDAPLITYKESIDYNLPQKCESLLNYTQNMAGETQSRRNAIIPFGDDFSFQNAFYNFRAIETVMAYCNEKYGKEFNIEFIYSTPGTFVDALRAEDVAWPTYSGDFLPYFDKDNYNRFWSGFYSTRPGFKLQTRQASTVYHAAAAELAKGLLRAGTSEKDA